MSGFTITIDDAQVRTALAKLVNRVSDMTPIMEDIGRALGNLTEDAFQAEGPGWPQLRPATVKKRGSAHPILQVSGGLAGSITHGGDATGAWVGASKIYAAIQQFGGEVKHAARASTVYFRQNKRTGAIGNRFVRRSRSNFAQDVTIGAHTTIISPRPYLPMTDDGELTPEAQKEVLDIASEAFRALLPTSS